MKISAAKKHSGARKTLAEKGGPECRKSLSQTKLTALVRKDPLNWVERDKSPLSKVQSPELAEVMAHAGGKLPWNIETCCRVLDPIQRHNLMTITCVWFVFGADRGLSY